MADSPLNPDSVEDVFERCLSADLSGITTEGIIATVIFDPGAIARHRDWIRAMLAELPDAFRSHGQGGGGGWSFLQACDDRHGQQWTGFQKIMDELFMLGMAAGMVEFCLPRSMWNALPGEMPYYVITEDMR